MASSRCRIRETRNHFKLVDGAQPTDRPCQRLSNGDLGVADKGQSCVTDTANRRTDCYGSRHGALPLDMTLPFRAKR